MQAKVAHRSLRRRWAAQSLGGTVGKPTSVRAERLQPCVPDAVTISSKTFGDSASVQQPNRAFQHGRTQVHVPLGRMQILMRMGRARGKALRQQALGVRLAIRIILIHRRPTFDTWAGVEIGRENDA
jgi:hypothetical protein